MSDNVHKNAFFFKVFFNIALARRKMLTAENIWILISQNLKQLLTKSADLKILVLLLLILHADAHDLLMWCSAFHTKPFIHVICERSFLVCTCAMSHSSGFLTKLLIGMLWLMSMKSQRKWSRIFYYPLGWASSTLIIRTWTPGWARVRGSK